MIRFVTGTVMTLALAGMAFAQVNGRRENQQDRIANGVQDGQLTAGETANLETKEQAINGEIRHDKAMNGGQLTNAEKARINRQQNRVSGQIYADKHNATEQRFGNSEVGQREENQQDRIANGIRSGKLNAGETAGLERREAGINRDVRADRAFNGGKLTPGEKRQVNRQLNRTSRRIYARKHN